MTGKRTYMPPSEGWVDFGTHADARACLTASTLEWSDETGEDGLPLWERHDRCQASGNGSSHA